MNIKINGKEYKVKFSYNTLCDTDILERVEDLARLLAGNAVESEEDVKATGQIKNLFVIVRDMLFVGFKKFNPVESTQDIGDLLDIYKEEETETEKHDLMILFNQLSEELMNEGFLSDVLKMVSENQPQNPPLKLQDHKKKEAKK